MFDGLKSLDEFYNTEDQEEYFERKLLEYAELLKIKEAITAVSKTKLYDLSAALIRKEKCYLRCYDRNADLIFKDAAKGSARLNECASGCKQELRDLKQFLRNVDKLVEIKNDNCHRGCRKQLSDRTDLTKEDQFAQRILFAQCQWVCYNKIDRRYRDFWTRQRDAIIQRHVDKQFTI